MLECLGQGNAVAGMQRLHQFDWSSLSMYSFVQSTNGMALNAFFNLDLHNPGVAFGVCSHSKSPMPYPRTTSTPLVPGCTSRALSSTLIMASVLCDTLAGALDRSAVRAVAWSKD